MTVTGIRSLDQSVQTTKEWLKDLQRELHTDDQQKCLSVFRAVMQALRDRLRVDEAAHLASELPMILQGVYYHEYDPSGKPEKFRHRQQFLDKVAQRLAASDVEPERACKAVFTMLDKRISKGEISDVKGDLPSHIRQLWS